MEKERVYFANFNFGHGKWGEVLRGEKWVGGDRLGTGAKPGARQIWERYLFRNGERRLVVFAPREWAKYNEKGEEVDWFPAEPRTHHQVWSYLAEFDPQPVLETLGIDPLQTRLEGEDSGPITS